MSPRFREVLRYVFIGLAFGLIWAVMQYANGQIRDVAALSGPVIVFGLAGLVMWAGRQLYLRLRSRN